MLSKLASWVFGKSSAREGTSSNDKRRANEYSGTSNIPAPPAIPARKTKSEINILNSTHNIGPTSQIDIENGGTHIPKALKSAFERPEKDKKPFSYFAQGHAPDLSSNPSPRLVKQANPLLNGPPVPKVLPFVTENDLKLEDRRPRSPMPAVTTVTNSSQYNTPIALYSKQTLQEEYSRRSVEPGKENHVTSNDVKQKSGHHLETRSYHQTEASDVEDTPRYTGYTNPNSQSPCFKRLQYMTGLHTDSEDEKPVEIKAFDVRRDGRTTAPPDASSQHIKYKNSEARQQQESTPEFQSQEMYGNGYHDTMSSSYHEMRRYYEHQEPQQDQIEDPLLLAKISEAERPRIPQSAAPDWIRQAEMKHDKWRGYGEYQQSHKYEGPPPPTVHFSPPTWRRSASRTPAFKESPAIRAKSIEPSSRYASYHGSEINRHKKEPWMKPFVAPNVMEHSTLTTPLTIRTSVETPTHRPTVYTPSFGTPVVPSSNHQQTYQYASKLSPTGYKSGPPPQWSSVNTNYSTSSGQRQETYSSRRSPVPQYRIETTYLTPLSETPQAKEATSVGVRDQPPWSTPKNDTDKKWHFQQEAYNKQKEMEHEMTRKARASSAGGVSPRWKPVPASERSLAPMEGPGITQKWQDDTGASTKSQTTGSYVDKDGNVVSYVKEIYTTSDPGKEFSMLTQEERKVLEEPLQPGVISRHTTTKYYKKSTYTSSTTTSTNSSQPAISNAPFNSTASSGSITYPRKYITESRY